MKRYGNSKFNHDKYRQQEWQREHNAGGFRCSHCKRFVVINEIMGTANRNHCNWCLWSKHVDEAKGDRRATCNSGMKPIGLTLKHEGRGKIGEIMLIHLCSLCQKISINRIARDDLECTLLDIFAESSGMSSSLRTKLMGADIYLLNEQDRPVLDAQLFGV